MFNTHKAFIFEGNIYHVVDFDPKREIEYAFSDKTGKWIEASEYGYTLSYGKHDFLIDDIRPEEIEVIHYKAQGYSSQKGDDV
jgi:hypothetical protein